MIGRDALDNIGMRFQQPGIPLFRWKKEEFFGAGLGDGKKQFRQQPAEFSPVRVGFTKAVEVFMSDEKYFGVLHRFDKIPAGIAGDEAPERNDKLVFGEKENVLILFGIGIAVIDPEDAFGDQAQVVADHLLHIEKISFVHFPHFPVRFTILKVFIVQLRKISQMFS
jgi:hypothetical protein